MIYSLNLSNYQISDVDKLSSELTKTKCEILQFLTNLLVFISSDWYIYIYTWNCLFTELPEKSIMLPPFVDSTHCLSYHLTRKGRCVADRVVSVLGYACPDITYSPSLYPITALLLHFMPGKCIINKMNIHSSGFAI